MLGPEQNLSAQKIQSLGDKISAALGRPTQVAKVYQCGVGANSRTHYVAETTTGAKVGLKASSRGVAGGDEKERLISELASVLDAPCTCRVSPISVDELPTLSGRAVNAIEWLPAGESLDRLPANVKTALRGDPSIFLRQYGEWMSLGLLFGVVDRNSGNWVWAQSTGMLCMIDNEESFHQGGGVQHMHVGIETVTPRVQLKADGPTAGHGIHLASGLSAMQQKYHDRVAQVQQILVSSTVAGFSSVWMQVAAADIVARVFHELA